MFGYLRLDARANKKLVDYWKANYCYLCRAIEREFGEKSRLALSYDITFLGVLLKRSEFFDGKKIRCFGNKASFDDEAFRTMAAVDLMLAYEMILDKKYDDGAAWASAAEAIFRKQERKIARDFPALHDEIDSFYARFRDMEKNKADCKTLADSFGSLMESIGRNHLHLEKERIKVLVSVARWIYVIDALDDLDKDIRKGQFNPFKPIATSGKDLLANHQEYWESLYSSIFEEANLDDNDISTFVIRRVYNYSIPMKTAEVCRRILR